MHKAKVTFKSLIVYIVLLFLWPILTQLLNENLMGEGLIPNDYFPFIIWFSISGVPIILTTALPVTILAGFVTKYLDGFLRLAVNFLIHIGSAILISLVLFKDNLGLFALIAIVVAAIFFTFDELPNFPKKREKGLLISTPFIILLIIMVPTWMNSYQVSQELKEIDQDGFPIPIVMINEKEVVIDDPLTGYSSTGTGGAHDILEPYILPLGILEDEQYEVYDVNGGDIISLSFDSEPDDYSAELVYLKEGTMFTERISDTNNKFTVPDNLEPQAIAINIVWPRHQVSFHIMVK
ncbi:hypothetical protein [Sutcliffiella halmapala]|uniref:hypothetical protein n=1 Tax=Sutcliffiella halmapala TaxID=79882 RepID=UPI00111654CC|nr:hypothetical protein [Sutcliffiella halmapala]